MIPVSFSTAFKSIAWYLLKAALIAPFRFFPNLVTYLLFLNSLNLFYDNYGFF